MTFRVPLDTLVTDPLNVRLIDDRDVAGLAASLQAVGQVQPIIVRRDEENPDNWRVVAGGRRVAAARSIGWVAMEAELMENLGSATPEAVSAAENMVRRPMHPVDQWRALASLKDGGYSLEGAADALGVPVHTARKLDHLARMAPEIIDALSQERELPQESRLRVIAQAPHDVQVTALTTGRRRQNKGQPLDWWAVSEACTIRRIPRSRAIFSIDDHPEVAWDEDLFAEPNADDQFTTKDVNGFLELQRAELKARAEASRGRIEVVKSDVHGNPVIPSGWIAGFEPVPKRWRKDDTRKGFVTVVEQGYETGRVTERLATQKTAPASTGTVSAPITETVPKPMFTKPTLAKIAAMKVNAIRDRLEQWAHMGTADYESAVFREEGAISALHALLVLPLLNSIGTTGSYLDLASKLFNEDGKPRDLYVRDLRVLVADVLSRSIITDSPAVDWLGRMIGTVPPRCDTEEILGGMSRDALVELARTFAIDEKGSARELKARMIGHLPDWHPVDFGALGPVQAVEEFEDVVEAEQKVAMDDPADDEQEPAETHHGQESGDEPLAASASDAEVIPIFAGEPNDQEDEG
jgi:ParB family chromosome partitioning protein